MNLLQISHEVVMNFTRIHESQSQISRTSQSFKTIKKIHNHIISPLHAPLCSWRMRKPPRTAWRPVKAPSRRLEAGEAPLAQPSAP